MVDKVIRKKLVNASQARLILKIINIVSKNELMTMFK